MVVLIFCGLRVAVGATLCVQFRFSVDDGDKFVLSVIGAYLPCVDH